MMMKYQHLAAFPKAFTAMTGLPLEAFDDLVAQIEPLYQTARAARLNRPARQRAMGGGDRPELSLRDQILLTVICLRQHPTQDVLGGFFGISQATVSRYIERVLPLLEQHGRDQMRMPDPGRKRRRKLDELLKVVPELMVVIDSFKPKAQRPGDSLAGGRG